MQRPLFRLRWKWRGRSPVKITERAREENQEALHSRREGDVSPDGNVYLVDDYRLDVAIFRAQILVVVVASPRPEEIRACNLDQIKLPLLPRKSDGQQAMNIRMAQSFLWSLTDSCGEYRLTDVTLFRLLA